MMKQRADIEILLYVGFVHYLLELVISVFYDFILYFFGSFF